MRNNKDNPSNIYGSKHIFSEGIFMVYDRQIKYFDYIVNGEKVKGAGFAKAEVRDGLCRLQIHIDGMPLTTSALRNVILRSAEKESVIAAVKIEGGKGDTGVLELKTYGLGDKEISYFDIEEITIPFDTRQCLRCIWSSKNIVTTFEMEKYPAKEVIEEMPEEAETEAETATETATEINSDELKAAFITSDEMCRRNNTYKDNKWECLAGMYEHGSILGEMTDCIVIRPADFVIMPEKYYKLAGNSFLLHGYHNYGYVLLIKMEKRKEAQYYIGVPGTYYEKEKDAAIMFGFEGFECGRDYVHPGDFGYYMVSVEL
jgi:hypothetical protein